MKRKRDSQKGKLYRAERYAFSGERAGRAFGSLDDVRHYLRKVFDRKRFKAQWPKARAFKVEGSGRAHMHARGWSGLNGGCFMTLPPWALKEWTVLHELAHGLVGLHAAPGQPGHGRAFAATYHALVKMVMGPMHAKHLAAHFRAHKVRYKPKRKRLPMTPERRAELVARLAKARETLAARRAVKRAAATPEFEKLFKF